MAPYEYRGEINGNFWRRQSFSDIYKLCSIKKTYNYYWKGCGCMIEDFDSTYCSDCYESYENHLEGLEELEDDDVDEDSEDEEFVETEFKKDKNILYEKSNYMIYTFNQDHHKQIKEKLKLIEKEIDMTSFSLIYDDDLCKIDFKDHYDDKQDNMVALYCLGAHIAHHLESNEDCQIEIY